MLITIKKCLFIRGNSASGKTTLAKLIRDQAPCSAFLISQDTVRREMLACKDGPATPALSILQEMLAIGHREFELVIVEGILRSDWYAPLFQQARDLYQENVLAYYFDLSFEETLLRHETKPQAREYGEDVLRSWWLEKDYSSYLREELIDRTSTLEEIVEIILRKL
ncbi:Uncharacterised protein [Chlamydia trachomatis]|nr:Uncharacterised protein [Chlamydia trachomatis]